MAVPASAMTGMNGSHASVARRFTLAVPALPLALSHDAGDPVWNGQGQKFGQETTSFEIAATGIQTEYQTAKVKSTKLTEGDK